VKGAGEDAGPTLAHVGFPDNQQLFPHEISVTIILLLQIGAWASHSLDQKTQLRRFSMKKTTVVRIAFTLLLAIASFATPVLADGGGPVPLCPQKSCAPGGGR
jgi:hypothetical protein